MKVRDVMTKDVEIIAPETSLKETAQRMRDLNVGSLPVGSMGNLVGMVTDRDIAIRAVAEGRDVAQTPVSQIMSGDVIVCDADQKIEDVADEMKDRRIRRIVVVDRDNHAVGMVSIGDLATYASPDLGGEVLEEICRP